MHSAYREFYHMPDAKEKQQQQQQKQTKQN